MSIPINWQMIAVAVTLTLAWTGFLLGAIKWLLNRQVAAMETEITTAVATAKEAKEGLTKHKTAVTTELSNMRVEFERRNICSNHQRMEGNDEKLFERMDELHGDIRELVGGVKGLTNSLALVNEHLLKGGK